MSNFIKERRKWIDDKRSEVSLDVLEKIEEDLSEIERLEALINSPVRRRAAHMLEETLRKLVKDYRSVMIWTPDGVIDNWQDDWAGFVTALEVGGFVRCDCENYALSVCRGVYELHILPDGQYGLMVVDTAKGATVNHCVAWFRINARIWIADNASRNPFYSLDEILHAPLQHSTYSNVQMWREVVL